MAGRRNKNNSGKRVDPTPTLAKLHSPALLRPANRSLILMQEDRREHHPEGIHRPTRALPKAAARLVSSPNVNKGARSKPFAVPSQLSFSVPKRVSLCVRRHQRREVIFALKKTGAGSRARRHKRNWWSNVKC